MSDILRRCRIDLMCPAELAIREAMLRVEETGCDTLLTDAVVLLSQAQSKVADFIDTQQKISLSMNEPTEKAGE